MGRCYEFGVSIREGCEHAMVVPAEGGRCECVGCGAPCTGRFKGCASVISQPGYIPQTAPRWSLIVADRATPAPTASAAPPSVPDVPPPMFEVPTAVPNTSSLETLVDLVEDLTKQIAARDEELGAVFDRFVDEFRRLREEITSQSRETATLGRRLDDLTARVDSVISASLLGPLQRDA